MVANNLGANTDEAGWVAGNVGTTANEASNPEDGYDGYPVIAATGGDRPRRLDLGQRLDDLGQDLDRPWQHLAR